MALARPRALLGLAVAVLAAGLYAPALGHDWLNYDDDLYITDNPEQLRGLSPEGLGWAFTSFHGANWFPLTRLSWALDLEIFGPSAAGFHATNLLLHAATSLMLFLALCRMSGRVGASAFVAAVFAAHPLHVESVAWAAARKDPLSAFFFMLALWIHAGGGREAPTARQRAGVFVCLALGLMAKPVVASLPAVLLLVDAWPLGRLHRNGRLDSGCLRRALLEKLPLLALVAAFAVLAIAAQRAGGAWVSFERIAFGDRLANALVAVFAYLGKTFWPTGLAVFYPHPGDTIPGWQLAGSLLGLVAISLAASRRAYLAVGWLWFLATLLPTLGLIQVGSQAMADRYMYLPLVGISLALAWGAAELAGGPRRARPLLAALGVAALAALSWTTLVQLRHWRDSESLFRHALAATAESSVAHAHLGAALLEQGRVRETLDHFERAVELDPGFLEAVNNLAWLRATLPQAELRDPPKALLLARHAAAESGHDEAAVLDTLAAAEAALGRFERAAETAEAAAALAATRGEAALAGAIRSRLALYRAGRPYRESPPSRRRATR